MSQTETYSFEFEHDGANRVENPPKKQPIHGITSRDAHDDWHNTAHDHGISVTAMLEALAPHVVEIFGDPERSPSLIVQRCRAIDSGKKVRSR